MDELALSAIGAKIPRKMGTVTVGIVVPSLTDGGGVPAVASFLCDALESSNVFDYRLFSVPMSSEDPASLRLLNPRSWFRGPMVEEGVWKGRNYKHFGAVGVELEFQRYRPRFALSSRLRECDLVQVVAGSPAWGLVARDVDRPLLLQVATLSAVERKGRFRHEEGLITSWRRLMTYITSYIDRKAVCGADRVFVENSWMKGAVEKWTDSEKVLLAPPGVDTDVFRPGSRRSKANSNYILSVGRFQDRRKNVGLLFDAYALLCEQVTNPPRLKLAGRSAPTRADWNRAEKLGVRERIQFDKNVPQSELAALYRNAILFVLASYEEGLGIVLLEAMASGLPVVSTSTEGAKEVVVDGRTGFLTSLDNACGLAQAMERLIKDVDLRRSMGQEGRARVDSRYSKKSAGDRFIGEYRKLCGLDKSHCTDTLNAT